jgi:hypothetical protein
VSLKATYGDRSAEGELYVLTTQSINIGRDRCLPLPVDRQTFDRPATEERLREGGHMDQYTDGAR